MDQNLSSREHNLLTHKIYVLPEDLTQFQMMRMDYLLSTLTLASTSLMMPMSLKPSLPSSAKLGSLKTQISQKPSSSSDPPARTRPSSVSTTRRQWITPTRPSAINVELTILMLRLFHNINASEMTSMELTNATTTCKKLNYEHAT